MASSSSDRKGNPLFTFLPAISKAHEQAAALDREIAAMRTVEAVRAYAAANSGRLPDHLDQLSETPAPNNLMTMQPFDYRTEGDGFVISDQQSARTTMEWTVKVK